MALLNGRSVSEKRKRLNRLLAKNANLLIGVWQFLTREELCFLETVSHYWHHLIVAESQPATMILRQLYIATHHLTINKNPPTGWSTSDKAWPENLILQQEFQLSGFIGRWLVIDPKNMRPPSWLRWQSIRIGKEPPVLSEDSANFLRHCHLHSVCYCELAAGFQRDELARKMDLLTAAQKLSLVDVGVEPSSVLEDVELVITWLESSMPLDDHLLADALFHRHLVCDLDISNYYPMQVAKRRLTGGKWWKRYLNLDSDSCCNSFITELDQQLKKRFFRIAVRLPFVLTVYSPLKNGCAMKGVYIHPLPYRETETVVDNALTGERLATFIMTTGDHTGSDDGHLFEYRWERKQLTAEDETVLAQVCR